MTDPGERKAIERVADWSRACLTMQGYGGLDDARRRELAAPLRLAGATFLALLVVGLVARLPALLVALGLGWIGSAFPPRHPLESLYNAVARRAGWPIVPPSPPEKRFSMAFGGAWVLGMGLFFMAGMPTVGWVMAAMQLPAAATTVTTNWCLPAFVYRYVPAPLQRGFRALGGG